MSIILVPDSWQRSEEGIRSSETRIIGGCESTCECWETIPDSQEELEELLFYLSIPEKNMVFLFRF